MTPDPATIRTDRIPTSAPESPTDPAAIPATRVLSLLSMYALLDHDEDRAARALELFDPAKVAETRAWLAEEERKHAAKLAERAVAQAARAAEPSADERRAERERQHAADTAAWAAWLDGGGRERIASRPPVTYTPPSVTDVVYLAVSNEYVNRDYPVSVDGWGTSPQAAAASAEAIVHRNLADPELAAEAYDAPYQDEGPRDPIARLLSTEWRFVQLIGEPGLVHRVARTIAEADGVRDAEHHTTARVGRTELTFRGRSRPESYFLAPPCPPERYGTQRPHHDGTWSGLDKHGRTFRGVVVCSNCADPEDLIIEWSDAVDPAARVTVARPCSLCSAETPYRRRTTPEYPCLVMQLDGCYTTMWGPPAEPHDEPDDDTAEESEESPPVSTWKQARIERWRQRLDQGGRDEVAALVDAFPEPARVGADGVFFALRPCGSVAGWGETPREAVLHGVRWYLRTYTDPELAAETGDEPPEGSLADWLAADIAKEQLRVVEVRGYDDLIRTAARHLSEIL